MVAKAKLTLERLASVETSRGSDVTVSKLKQNSALSSQLPESTNYKVMTLRIFILLLYQLFQTNNYEPTDKDQFLTSVPSRDSYSTKISVSKRRSEDAQAGYLDWATNDKTPVLITEDTQCRAMSIYEYKFWLDMTDVKTGYIRKQGKGT